MLVQGYYFEVGVEVEHFELETFVKQLTRLCIKVNVMSCWKNAVLIIRSGRDLADFLELFSSTPSHVFSRREITLAPASSCGCGRPN